MSKLFLNIPTVSHMQLSKLDDTKISVCHLNLVLVDKSSERCADCPSLATPFGFAAADFISRLISVDNHCDQMYEEY